MTTNHPPRKPALGRGLGALIAPTATAAVAAPAAAARPQGLQQIPLAKIDVNPYQPRKQFGEEALRELADSISRHGLLAPLVVRPKGDTFELIAGERRLRWPLCAMRMTPPPWPWPSPRTSSARS